MVKIRTNKKDGHKYPIEESGSKSDKGSPVKKSKKDKEDPVLSDSNIEKTESNEKTDVVADKLESSDKKEKESGDIGDLSSKQRKEVESHVGSEIVEVRDDGYDAKMYEFENGEEWLIFDSEKDAEKEAKKRVRDDLESEPELFNQDWLNHFMDISDTDARLFGNDFGDMMVEDADLDELKDLANRYDIDFDDPEDKLDSDDEEYDDKLEKANEKLKNKLYDEVSSARSDEVEKIIKRDGLKSFVCDDEGLCREEEFMEQYGKWLVIDYDEAVDDAISTDGVAHFLSPYDGDEVVVNGLYMYRWN